MAEERGGRRGNLFFLLGCLLFLTNALQLLYSVSVQVFVMHDYMQYEHAYEQILQKELIQFPIENVIYQL